MDRISVTSRDIESVGHEDGTLEIKFHRGGIYQYYNVPESVYRALMTAISKGKYFHRNIKKIYTMKKIR